MDVKTAFLHGDLEEQIYMEQPDGFIQPGHEHLIGYKRCEYDCCVYVKSLDDGFFIFLLLNYQDLGAATKILGMEIHRDRGSRKLWLSQRGYVEKVLDRFGMSKAKPVSTPLANHFKLSSEQCPKTDHEIEDMAKVSYASNVPLVDGYVDSGYAGDLDDRRSITRYVFTLGGGPICWKSTVQSIIALFTTEAEYMAVVEAAKEALWLNGLAKELGVEQGRVQLHYDSQSAIYLAKNQKVHTSENAADMLTKPLTIDKFNHCLDLLNVYSCWKSMVTQRTLVCEKLRGCLSPKGLDICQGGDLLGMAHIPEKGWMLEWSFMWMFATSIKWVGGAGAVWYRGNLVNVP
ncbi:UNVERIFIED_CONTAM: Retrovirus-related Pol polyprotein from transposon TNT 1-94 [Sesamum latifolium]|uniref:Retrovirus-related Pol polyprotein from transposon TNT 1-94 n=1 Tax=Sesamum latifolium TaxID=2727402 RepID=A0AAW2Y0V5_9LAMI